MKAWTAINRSRIHYALVLAAVGTLAFIFRYGEAYMALYAVILLPVASFLATAIFCRLLKISITPKNTHVIKKEETSYELNIRSVIGCELEITLISAPNRKDDWGFAQKPVTDVLQYGGFTRSYKISFPYRGEYRVGVESIVLRDPLGLFTFRRKINTLSNISVYPRLTEPDISLLGLSASSTETRARRVENDYSDVRKYDESDSYKKIHWKLSAKKNELMVKDFDGAEGNKFTLLLDISPSTLAAEDAAIELTLALAKHLLGGKTRIELAYATDTLVRLEASDQSEFYAVYSLLAELKFDGVLDMPEILLSYAFELEDFCTIIVITHRLDDKLYEAILSARERTLVILIFIAKSRYYTDEAAILEKLEAAGVFCSVRQGDC